MKALRTASFRPGPIRRRPEAVAGLRQEFVRDLDAGQVPEQHAMGVQRALGRPGRARGVDHQRRIVGGGVDRRELRGGAPHRLEEAVGAAARPVD
jgi:hypothetical protein